MVGKTRQKGSTAEQKRATEPEEQVPVLTRGCDECSCNRGTDDISGFAYFLGVIGAMAYYVSTASSFWMGALGMLKALVWPAFLVFELMRMLGM